MVSWSCNHQWCVWYYTVSTSILLFLLTFKCFFWHSIAYIVHLRHFCILYTRPKSCFGGLNEQSGYLVCNVYFQKLFIQVLDVMKTQIYEYVEQQVKLISIVITIFASSWLPIQVHLSASNPVMTPWWCCPGFLVTVTVLVVCKGDLTEVLKWDEPL